MEKLYVVVRGDLNPGLRAAQACHALRQFAADHPEADLEWFENSNTIVLLEVPDIEALADLAFALDRRDIKHAQFIEPDLGRRADGDRRPPRRPNTLPALTAGIQRSFSCSLKNVSFSSTSRTETPTNPRAAGARCSAE